MSNNFDPINFDLEITPYLTPLLQYHSRPINFDLPYLSPLLQYHSRPISSSPLKRRQHFKLLITHSIHFARLCSLNSMTHYTQNDCHNWHKILKTKIDDLLLHVDLLHFITW